LTFGGLANDLRVMGEMEAEPLNPCPRCNLRSSADLRDPPDTSHVYHVCHVCQDLMYKVMYNFRMPPFSGNVCEESRCCERSDPRLTGTGLSRTITRVTADTRVRQFISVCGISCSVRFPRAAAANQSLPGRYRGEAGQLLPQERHAAGWRRASEKGPGNAPQWGPPKPHTIAFTRTLSTRSSRLARDGERSGNTYAGFSLPFSKLDLSR